MKIKRSFITSKPISLPSYNFKISNPLFQKNGTDFNIGFYEGVLENNPYLVECLIYLGNAYTAKGMCKKGLEIDKRLSRLRPDDPVIIYNLACSYSLTKEIEPAISTLKRAIELGYNDIEQLEMDRDIDNIRNDKRYKELVNILRKKERVVIIKLRRMNIKD